MADKTYDDGGRGRTIVIGPDQLPPGDPRLNGFPDAPGVAAERLIEQQARHPQTGQFVSGGGQ
jgi:hypothetical protein